MPGCFGLLDGWHDRIVPPDRMVEMHPVCSVHDLDRAGLLTLGTHARIEGPHGAYLTSVREAGILELDGQRIVVTWHSVLPLHVLVCPRCGGDKYKLHRAGTTGWACRTCHGLTYASRHLHRTIPGLGRLQWLRARIGASPVPFSPLPRKRLSARRHWALCAEIRAIEARLIAHGRDDVAAVLERRNDRQ